MYRTLRGVESLESKRLLACDVDFDGEKLEIKCDDQGDLIFMNEAGGDLFVSGQNLGSAKDLKDIVIESGGGGDAIIISNLDVEDSIEIKTGGDSVGNDETDDVIALANVSVGNDLKIEMGEGADFVFFQGAVTVENSVDIKLGKGNDEVFSLFGSLTAGNDIKIDGEKGADTVTGVDNLFAGNELELKSIKNVS